MAEKDLIKIARENVDAFNAADWIRMADLVAADATFDEMGMRRSLKGLDQIREALQGWRQAMPDATGTVTEAYASGNTVILEITWTGTHTGSPVVAPGRTILATGKRYVSPSCWVLVIEDEKIQESREYFDLASLLEQLEATPAAR